MCKVAADKERGMARKEDLLEFSKALDLVENVPDGTGTGNRGMVGAEVGDLSRILVDICHLNRVAGFVE